MTEVWVLVGFHVLIGAVLAFDLGFRPRGRSVRLIEAATWSGVWVLLALGFAAAIWQFWPIWQPAHPDLGRIKALEFPTGYLIEKALSIDNLFVFLVVFRYFGVPAPLQRTVLLWGILGALVLRAGLIVAGAVLLTRFFWMNYVFGAFLMYSACQLARTTEEATDPSRNVVLRVARRFLPVTPGYHASRFLVRQDGRWFATPLLLVLLVVETTDVLFALDSIPAVFGITRDVFIVYTSNVFAILGLRALYFLLARFLEMFHDLGIGLAVVLAFVGLKMMVEQAAGPSLAAHGWNDQVRTLTSLGVIAGILTIAVLTSLIRGPRPPAPNSDR